MSAANPAWRRQLRALLLKDLRLELRTRDTVVAMVLFAIVAMVIFQFAFGSREDDLSRFAGGILWATLALTAVLGVGRSWVPEREQRVLDMVAVHDDEGFGNCTNHGACQEACPQGISVDYIARLNRDLLRATLKAAPQSAVLGEGAA